MFNLKNLAFIRHGAALLEKLMREGGMPTNVKLRRIEPTVGGLLFYLDNDTCWKATVKLSKVEDVGPGGAA